MSGFGLDPVPGMDDRNAKAPVKTRGFIGLRIVCGPKAGQIFTSTQPIAVIGRNDPPDVTVDIDLTDAEIGDPPMTSRRHAQIERNVASGETYLTDIGSTNGTWINGERLSPGIRSQALTVPLRVYLANMEFETTYVAD
jgi:pSer/pThr/pTyr-binding forkhead associated (FHA) protein